MRCGKCAPCKRWIVSLDRSETCEKTVTPKTPARPVSTAGYAWAGLPERARDLEEALARGEAV